jgi:hypothetical protein
MKKGVANNSYSFLVSARGLEPLIPSGKRLLRPLCIPFHHADNTVQHLTTVNAVGVEPTLRFTPQTD